MPLPNNSELLYGLNSEQVRAVTAAFERPLLVLAGAGSGKTLVLTRRIAYLAEKFCAPERVLALTFTRAAAREMAGRLTAFANGGAGRGAPLVTTFHAFCLRVLFEEVDGKRNCTRLGYRGRPRLVPAQIRPRMIAAASTRSERLLLGMDVLELEALVLKRLAFPKKQDGLSAEQEACIETITGRYSIAKKQAGLWDFADFIAGALRLFDTEETIAKHYESKYLAVLVDEFQDTNPVQIKLLKRLLTANKPFFAVGDDDQAIYGFQGADRRTILNFAEHFQNSEIVKLQTNYRSTPAILAAANKIFRKKPGQYGKVLRAGLIAKTVSEQRKPVKKIFETEDEMSIWLADTIRKLKADHALDFSGIAILFRLNQTRDSMEALLKKESVFDSRLPRLLTVHSAKGMEFDAVFLCDLEEGIFPGTRGITHNPSFLELLAAVVKRNKSEEEELGEEQRLFYVGVTRAKRFLWLVSVRNKELYGRTMRFEGSRFLRLV
ncbi:MAG TPA: ATP-dependent helicase [Chitinivibrionales bacterium]|nr:ATP-dependent helicase [Chitinivibrionales bacterium]